MLDGVQPDGNTLPEVERAGVPFIAHPMPHPDVNVLNEGFDVGYQPPDKSDEDILTGKVSQDDVPSDAWRTDGRFVVDFEPQGIPARRDAAAASPA